MRSSTFSMTAVNWSLFQSIRVLQGAFGGSLRGMVAAMRSEYRYGPDFRDEVVLRDGTQALIRPVTADDKDLLRRGFELLSPDSRVRRFFTLKHGLSDSELAYLTECDGVDHFALGATRPREGKKEDPLGVARFVRLPQERACAEAAVTVIDSFQGRGLGKCLFTHLVAAARERGIEHFRAEVLSRNKPVRALLAEAGDSVTFSRGSGGLVAVDMRLPDLDVALSAGSPERSSPSYRLLQAVAQGDADMQPRWLPATSDAWHGDCSVGRRG